MDEYIKDSVDRFRCIACESRKGVVLFSEVDEVEGRYSLRIKCTDCGVVTKITAEVGE